MPVCQASTNSINNSFRLLGIIISCPFLHKNYSHPCFCLFRTETFLYRIDKHPLVVQYHSNFIYHAPLPEHRFLLRHNLTKSLYVSNHPTLLFNQIPTFCLQETAVQKYVSVINSLANIPHFSATWGFINASTSFPKEQDLWKSETLLRWVSSFSGMSIILL